MANSETNFRRSLVFLIQLLSYMYTGRFGVRDLF